jgi:hypothetical protein
MTIGETELTITPGSLNRTLCPMRGQPGELLSRRRAEGLVPGKPIDEICRCQLQYSLPVGRPRLPIERAGSRKLYFFAGGGACSDSDHGGVTPTDRA